MTLLKINIAISHRQKLKAQYLRLNSVGYRILRRRLDVHTRVQDTHWEEIRYRMKIKEKEETMRKVDFETGGGRRGKRKNQYKQR